MVTALSGWWLSIFSVEMEFTPRVIMLFSIAIIVHHKLSAFISGINLIVSFAQVFSKPPFTIDSQLTHCSAIASGTKSPTCFATTSDSCYSLTTIKTITSSASMKHSLNKALLRTIFRYAHLRVLRTLLANGCTTNCRKVRR